VGSFRFDPYSPAVDADPFPYYRRLRDEFPCLWSEEAQMWILSRYADIVSAGQDWQTYSSASGNLMTELPGRAGSTLGSSDPPKHDRLRGLIQHAFLKRNLTALEGHIREVAASVFGQLRDQPEFDFKDVSSQFTVKVLMAALGLPMGDEAIVDEQVVRDNAVLMVQSDARTRGRNTSPPTSGCRTTRPRSSPCAVPTLATISSAISPPPNSMATGSTNARCCSPPRP
jgi:cytochrome P450